MLRAAGLHVASPPCSVSPSVSRPLGSARNAMRHQHARTASCSLGLPASRAPCKAGRRTGSRLPLPSTCSLPLPHASIRSSPGFHTAWLSHQRTLTSARGQRGRRTVTRQGKATWGREGGRSEPPSQHQDVARVSTMIIRGPAAGPPAAPGTAGTCRRRAPCPGSRCRGRGGRTGCRARACGENEGRSGGERCGKSCMRLGSSAAAIPSILKSSLAAVGSAPDV